MTAVQFKSNGKIIIPNGQIAMDPACCCPYCQLACPGSTFTQLRIDLGPGTFSEPCTDSMWGSYYIDISCTSSTLSLAVACDAFNYYNFIYVNSGPNAGRVTIGLVLGGEGQFNTNVFLTCENPTFNSLSTYNEYTFTLL